MRIASLQGAIRGALLRSKVPASREFAGNFCGIQQKNLFRVINTHAFTIGYGIFRAEEQGICRDRRRRLGAPKFQVGGAADLHSEYPLLLAPVERYGSA